MEHAKIDALVSKMNVDTATGPVDARVQQVVIRLLSDLFKAMTSTSMYGYKGRPCKIVCNSSLLSTSKMLILEYWPVTRQM